MNEDDLRDAVIKAFRRRKAHVCRVEPAFGSTDGYPDLNIGIDRMVIELELKVVKVNGSISIRSTQYKWFKDRCVQRCVPWMVIGHHDITADCDTFFVVPGLQVAGLSQVLQLINGLGYAYDSVQDAVEAIIQFSKDNRDGQ